MAKEKIIRKKKLNFVRQDTNKTKRLKKGWRKPKGIHSKLRLNKKGHSKKPSQGYRAPKKIRGIKPVIVYNLQDLEDKKSIIIAATVGTKKKVELLKKTKEKDIEVLNVRDVDAFIKKVEDGLKKKKEEKKSKKEKKKKTKEELEKKGEKKEGKKDEEEEKKEISKKLAKDVAQKPAEVVDKAPQSKTNIHRATAPKQK